MAPNRDLDARRPERYPPFARLGATKRRRYVKLERKVELISNSSDRLQKSLGLSRDRTWWGFMRQEAWIHLKRSWELWWMVLRKKE
jgi:hypothetical protein